MYTIYWSPFSKSVEWCQDYSCSEASILTFLDDRTNYRFIHFGNSLDWANGESHWRSNEKALINPSFDQSSDVICPCAIYLIQCLFVLVHRDKGCDAGELCRENRRHRLLVWHCCSDCRLWQTTEPRTHPFSHGVLPANSWKAIPLQVGQFTSSQQSYATSDIEYVHACKSHRSIPTRW